MGKLDMPVISALGRKRQEDYHKCEDNLGYLGSSRPSMATY